MADNVFEKAAEKLSSTLENERKEAVLELLKLKDSRGIDLLAKLVDSDSSVDVRYNARKVYYLLSDIHPNNPKEPFLELPEGISLDDLEKLLLDENPRIREEGLTLAGKLDPGSVAPTLRTVIPAEKNIQIQGRLLLLLGRAGLNCDIFSLAGFLASSEPYIRSNAINALARIGGVDALEWIVPMLQDPDSGVRACATEALPALGSSELLNLLKGMAMSPNVAYREAAVYTLQRFKAVAAAKILAHLAAVDPVIALRDKARAGLEAMATSDKNARQILAQLNKPEEIDDPNAPAEVPLDGVWETMTPATDLLPGEEPPPPPPKRKVMVVPGLTKKLVKEICLGDQALRENGLRQLAPLLKPEHAPFLLLQLEREKDPRISSHILTLIGKTESQHAYAAVIKCFKDPDNRVRANAIEAAMKIDPQTTPERIVSFLSDPNNRVRANAIIASAVRPNFDPLVWVRDLAGFPDPAYRRSAIFVITKLQRPNFLALLEFLVQDDELEIRHMAYKAILDYAERGGRKAKELAEMASKLMGKENKLAGLSDTDFHEAMVAMRAPTAPKKVVKKQNKSTMNEFGEQLLGTDGLKKAGQSMANFKNQANAARQKVLGKLSKTTANLASVNWLENLWFIALGVFLFLHVVNAAYHFRGESPLKLINFASAILAGGVGVLFAIFKRPEVAAVLALVLLFTPFALSKFDIQDSNFTGRPRIDLHHEVVKTPPVSMPASRTATIASVSLKVNVTASPTVSPTPPVVNGPTIKLIQPNNGTKVVGDFVIKAAVKEKPKSVEFFLDSTVLKNIEDKKDGTFECKCKDSDDRPSGRHAIKARVIDMDGHKSEDMIVLEFINRLAKIAITSPASGGVFWRDDRLAATVDGKECEQVVFVLDNVEVNTFPVDPSGKYEFPVAMSTLSEGMHTFEVRASMSDGRVATGSVKFQAMVPKPAVRFLNPKNGENVSGAVEVVVEADSGFKQTAIRNVTWFADDMEKKAQASSPMKDTWETVDLTSGQHELKATIENELGGTAETVIKVNVGQSKFAVAIKGIQPGQILEKDTTGTVEVADDTPETKVSKVVLSLDDVPFKEAKTAPLTFTIPTAEILPGTRKLTAEAFLSDGQSSKTSLSFSVNLHNNHNSCSLFFLAKDGENKLLSTKDLEKIHLEVKEDGKNIEKYTLQQAEDIPLHFGLIIGVSESMKSDQKLTKTQEAFSAFIDILKPQDQAFLIKFSDAPKLVVNFTEDRTKLHQEIEYLAAQGGTALRDAVYLGAEVSSKVPERTIMVVLTDTGDENAAHTAPASKHTLEEVVEIARKQDVQILPVSLGVLAKNSFSDGDADLHALCKPTGGRFYPVSKVPELLTFFKTIVRDIKSQTKLSFSSSTTPDGKWHTLELTAPDRKDIKFLYKPGYQAK
ncbi:MAG: VWA domain-containing protein [Candidatus Riflebacteria bacterium]|nr:VWA domain-containing protein [Candidatus Riflebacteria bacterium]